jgi:hypothetical protein
MILALLSHFSNSFRTLSGVLIRRIKPANLYLAPVQKMGVTSVSLGWNKDLFREFESSLPYTGRSRPTTERIRKKYLRIAYHTFLAHLADNVHYKDDRGYFDAPKPSRYRGPWQIWKRDIDPTHWLRSTCDPEWDDWDKNVWWRPFEFKFSPTSNASKEAWVRDDSDLPQFRRHVTVQDTDQNGWYALSGFSRWAESEIIGETSALLREIKIWTNSILVKRKFVNSLQEELKESTHIYPDSVSSTSTHHQVYIGEYPWHPSVQIHDQIAADEAREIKTPHIIPHAVYEWERGSGEVTPIFWTGAK